MNNAHDYSQYVIGVESPGGSNLLVNTGDIKRPGFYPWVHKIPWRRDWQPTPVFLPGESYGQRILGATVHGVTKDQT